MRAIFSTELYRYAHWLCRDHFQAEDLVQETFTKAWQGLSSLRDAKAVKSWLYTILRREHARLYERKRLDIDEHQDLVLSGPGWFQRLRQSENSRCAAIPVGRVTDKLAAVAGAGRLQLRGNRGHDGSQQRRGNDAIVPRQACAAKTARI